MSPIGVDDFEKIHTAGYYFVDKTNLIKELLLKDDMQNILKYGIAYYKKQCKIVLEQER